MAPIGLEASGLRFNYASNNRAINITCKLAEKEAAALIGLDFAAGGESDADSTNRYKRQI
jgi:ABC-type phosphate/phosphonate transport system ATPase subunit